MVSGSNSKSKKNPTSTLGKRQLSHISEEEEDPLDSQNQIKSGGGGGLKKNKSTNAQLVESKSVSSQHSVSTVLTVNKKDLVSLVTDKRKVGGGSILKLSANPSPPPASKKRDLKDINK